MTRKIVVGSYNFELGGMKDGDDTRLRRQLAGLSRHSADVWAFQECSHWRAPRARTVNVVEKALGMRGYFARSNRGPGGDLAVFVRASSGIRVVEPRHEETPLWWHGVALVIAEVDGFGLLRFASGHLAPSSPAQREIEAEAFGMLCEQPHPIVAGGDWNAVPVGSAPPATEGIHAGKARRKQDDRAARALAEYMTDIGTYLGSTVPTVGHTRGGKLAYRCDRLYTTLPPETITGFDVIRDMDADADHRPVIGEFTLGT